MNIRSNEIIKNLNLAQHPEGGWYSETYRSTASKEFERGERSLATVIYFMLAGAEISAFHKLNSDEFWYYHEGSIIDVHILYENGAYELRRLGAISSSGTTPQLLLPAGCWFAAECQDKASYSLVSCSVHPGFDFEDFKLANREELSLEYPEQLDLIERFCIR